MDLRNKSELYHEGPKAKNLGFKTTDKQTNY